MSAEQKPPGWMSVENFVKAVKAMLPEAVVAGSGRKTHGRWRDHDGRVREVLKSGAHDDLYDEVVDMLRNAGIVNPETVMAATHVEMKLAAILRREHISDAILVINNRPCGWDKPDWTEGCEQLLPKLLYPGQRMTVVGSDGFERTYVGGTR